MEQTQQQLSDESNLSSSSSPRRKKAPLDLDTALYLQSQASYVQEPNSPKGVQNPIARTILKNETIYQHQYKTTQQQQQPQVLVDAVQQLNRRQSLNPLALYNDDRIYNHNISVDYIDCVSNNDLIKPTTAFDYKHNIINDRFTMRGISNCKKHLRFHRNRVEPSTPINSSSIGDSSNSINLQQQEISTISRNNNNNNYKNNNNLPLLVDDGDKKSNDESSNRVELASLNETSGLEITNNAINSVLYPISVSEVKKRTYFIGQLSQDSLLGHDELIRYFPNGRVSIFVCTWNQNRKRSPMNLNDLLLPDQLINMPDIYAIGIQEAFSSQNDYLKEWEIDLQTTLGTNHVLLHSCSLGVLHLALFVRRDLIWFCSTPEESVYNSRSMPTNMIKTKGAVSIAFRFFGTSFMFTNCHFPAHENKLKDRIDEYQRIINSIDLPKNLKSLKPRYLSNDSTARFDCCFFMGDLNFRLEQRTFDETVTILEDIFQQKEPSYEILTQNDELLKVMETNQAFHGFDECQIKFPPTYKFLAQTNKYDRQTKRVPSYTDRILFRSKRQRHIQCLIYDWLPQLVSSDHKPVYCLFDVLVRPGREQNMVTSLNAGLFQRTIYLEALKRRAEDSVSMRENGTAGSLICSIS